MPAPASADEFLDLVQKSGVVEKPKLDAYAQKLRDAGTLPAEPGKLAGLLVRDAHLTYFQAEQLLQGKWKRFFIGKYKVLEKIGSGGMGQVFLCEHKLMRRRVALKVLPTAKAADPSSLDRFYREARAVAALDHPNIVRAYDIDMDENLHFLVMEFVDGINLQDLVKKIGPLDVLRACHYAYGSAVGLQYAFDMGIVHRDIKPANVLIDRAGVVKILDMGLARFFNDEDDQLTKKYDENVLGTADYLAPEQAVDSHTVDIRADLYSLGGTFYFLLTGLPPFPEGSVAQKLLWHQTREPKPVQALRPEIPDGVAAVVAKMMAKEPSDRYATPADLIVALAPWVQTPIPPPPERELPQFSPAAIGAGAGGLAGRPAVSGVLLTGSGRLRAGSPSSGAGRTPVPAAVAQATPPANTVPVPPAVAQPGSPPPGEAPGGVWESLASETQADAKADTGSGNRVPRPPRSWGAAHGRGDRGTTRKRPPRWVLVLAVVGLLAVVGAGYGVYRALAPGEQRAGTQPRAGASPADGRTWYVARDGGGPAPDRTVPGLFEAIRKAGPGDTVVLLDDQITDPPMRIDSSSFRRFRDVTVEAGNAAKSVRWVPAGTGQAKAALELVNVEGFRLRGLVIDVHGQFDYGVSAVDHVPGLLLEEVTVRGPRVAGVRLLKAWGDPDRPAVLDRVQVMSDTPYEAGVVCAGDARLATKHVHVTGCRIDGPAQAGVRVEGAASDVEVRHTRVYNVTAGVVFAAPPPANVPLKVRVVGNTFHTIRDAAVRADVPLPAHLGHEIVVSQNYFAKSAALAKAADGKLPGPAPDTNARDAESKEGNVPLSAVVVPNARLDTRAGDGFLRYGKGSPLGEVGPKKLPVGVPPE